MYKQFQNDDKVIYATSLSKVWHKGTFAHYRENATDSFAVHIFYDDEWMVLPVRYCIPFKDNESLVREKVVTSDKNYYNEPFKNGDIVLVRNSNYDSWIIGVFKHYSYYTDKKIYRVDIPVISTDIDSSNNFDSETKVFSQCIFLNGNEKYFMSTRNYK